MLHDPVPADPSSSVAPLGRDARVALFTTVFLLRAFCNRVVCANVGEGRFVTMFLGVLDARQRTLAYVNAGHDPPLLLGRERFLELQVGGPLLGVVPEAAYHEDEVALGRGDRIVLYTDGMTEAMGNAGEFQDDATVLVVAIDS